jgi:hypothetical protein
MQDDYHIMARQEQVVMFRFRTEDNRLRGHMYTIFQIGNSARCACGQVPQTAEHIQHDCV